LRIKERGFGKGSTFDQGCVLVWGKGDRKERRASKKGDDFHWTPRDFASGGLEEENVSWPRIKERGNSGRGETGRKEEISVLSRGENQPEFFEAALGGASLHQKGGGKKLVRGGTRRKGRVTAKDKVGTKGKAVKEEFLLIHSPLKPATITREFGKDEREKSIGDKGELRNKTKG